MWFCCYRCCCCSHAPCSQILTAVGSAPHVADVAAAVVAAGGRNWGSALARCCCSWGSYYFEVKVGPLGPPRGGPSGGPPSEGIECGFLAADQVMDLPVKGWGEAKTIKEVAKVCLL